MNELPVSERPEPPRKRTSITPTDLSDSLLKIIKDWWAVLAPIAAATTAALTAVGISNSVGQMLGWTLAIAFAGIAVLLWRRKQREAQEQTNREELLKEFQKGRAIRRSFRGLASFGREDFLPGPQRRRETGTIFTQVSADAFRFGIISGDTGAGKSSLLRAELFGLLEGSGFVVELLGSPRQAWLDAGANAPDIDQAIRIIQDWLGGRFDSATAPRFLIVDQFEELFIRFRSAADRRKLGRYLDELIHSNPPARVLCAVRRDHFIDFRDLAPDLAEPLSTKNTFLVRNFSRIEAAEVIRECAAHDQIEMPAEIPELLANDLAEQDEVRPAELQIVCTALRGDFRLQHYRTAGGASAILSKHIALAVETTRHPGLARLILRSLCDFTGNAKAQATSIGGLIRRIGPQRDVLGSPETEIQLILEQFEAERLVVRARTTDGGDQWSLIHDYLVGPVKLATQDASTRAEDAVRILEGYLAEARDDDTIVIPTGKLLAIRRHCPPDILRSDSARRLMRRSYVVGYGRPALMVALATLITGSLALYLGTESIWHQVGEFRHWADNESGQVELFRRAASTRKVITSDQKGAVIWDETGTELGRHASDDSSLINQKYLLLWAAANKVVKTVNLDTLEERSFAANIERDGFPGRLRFAASVVDDHLVVHLEKLQIFSIVSGKLIFSEQRPVTSRTSVQVSPSRDRVLMFMKGQTEDSVVPGIWSISSGRFVGQIAALGGPSSWFASSNDAGEAVVAQRVDNETLSIQVWNISESTPKLRADKRIKIDKFVAAKDQTSTLGVHDLGLSYVDNLIYVWTLGRRDEGTIFQPALFRAADLEMLEVASSKLPSGQLTSNQRSLIYFARADDSLAIWDRKTANLARLAGIKITRKDSLTLNGEGNLLLVSRPSSTFEIWNIDSGSKQSTISAFRLKRVFFGLDGKTVAALQEGGTLRLWSLSGRPLGAIAGVGSGNTVVSRRNCEATVWTSEGQVLRLVRGWRVLGLFFFPHRECA